MPGECISRGLQVQEEFRFMTAKPSRVGIAASSLFNPSELAAPNKLASFGVGAHWDTQGFPASTGQRNVARSLFDT